MQSPPSSLPTSDRLVFKTWKDSDFDNMFRLTSNEQTQRFFPKVHDTIMAKDLFNRLRKHFDEFGYTYYPVYEKQHKEFVGFIGCAWQKGYHPLCPFVDIGWRLLPEFWGKGFATEGAKACMDHFFQNQKEDILYALAPKANRPSIGVMKKMGMNFIEYFEHPKLKESPTLSTCELHSIDRSQWKHQD